MHEGTTGLVNGKVISQLIVMQLQKLLTGCTIVSWDTESAFNEEKTIVELEKWISFGFVMTGAKSLSVE